MSGHHSSHQFAAATIAQGRAINSADHELVIRQKPAHAKVFVGKEKDRKPIDPPPIIQLKISESIDPAQNYLQSPYYFISCSLLAEDDSSGSSEREEIKNALAGTLVSSLHRLKDTDNQDGGFFVFGDLSVKLEGFFRLQFTLYEVRDREVEYIKSISSEPFQVHAAKNWPGMAESTFLTRSFSDQGVRLRLRKEPRFRLGPRGPASDDYQPRHYNTQKRRQSQAESSATVQQQSMYSQPPEGYPGMGRQSHLDYPGMMQQPQAMGAQTPGMLAGQRKRDYAQSSPSGSFGSHGDESAKRVRTGSDQSQQSYGGQAQYTLQGAPFGGRTFPEGPQGQQFSSFGQPPQQLYGGVYSSSPQSVVGREPTYYSPRHIDTGFSTGISPFESPGGRASTQFQRSPASATPSSFPYYPMPQQPQPQYPPAITQPFPTNRASLSMPMYSPTSVEPLSAPPRANPGMTSEMPPPLYGGRPSPMGPTQMGSSHIPPPSADTKTWPYDFNKPRDDNPPR